MRRRGQRRGRRQAGSGENVRLFRDTVGASSCGLWSIKSISSTDWMSWGISYAREDASRRGWHKAKCKGGGGVAAIDAKVFGQKKPQKPLDVVCVGKTCGTKLLANKAKTLAAPSLFIQRAAAPPAPPSAPVPILAFAIICVYNSHLANGPVLPSDCSCLIIRPP